MTITPDVWTTALIRAVCVVVIVVRGFMVGKSQRRMIRSLPTDIPIAPIRVTDATTPLCSAKVPRSARVRKSNF